MKKKNQRKIALVLTIVTFAVLGFVQSKQPVADILRKTLAAESLEKMLAQYKTLKRTQFNKYDFGLNQLIGLGQELLAAKKFDEAIAVFKLNCEEFPYSAWSYDNLARAYQAAGQFKPAIENYEKAFALDKRYSQVPDIIRELKKKVN